MQKQYYCSRQNTSGILPHRADDKLFQDVGSVTRSCGVRSLVFLGGLCLKYSFGSSEPSLSLRETFFVIIVHQNLIGAGNLHKQRCSSIFV